MQLAASAHISANGELSFPLAVLQSLSLVCSPLIAQVNRANTPMWMGQESPVIQFTQLCIAQIHGLVHPLLLKYLSRVSIMCPPGKKWCSCLA